MYISCLYLILSEIYGECKLQILENNAWTEKQFYIFHTEQDCKPLVVDGQILGQYQSKLFSEYLKKAIINIYQKKLGNHKHFEFFIQLSKGMSKFE